MKFDIRARLSYAFAEPAEVLLLLEAAQGGGQAAEREQLVLRPALQLVRKDDPVSGERRVVFTACGEVEVRYAARIEVAPRPTGVAGLPSTAIRDLPAEVLPYLRASRYCPSDLFETFAKRRFGGLEGGDQVQAILDWIGGEITYQAGVSDAHSGAQETFVARAGVCRDFAHLAITLCRAADIPARMVSAYAWGLDPPDMHAVAEVFLAGQWRLVDPTGKAPVEALVRVATGLDAADIAFMTIFGAANLLDQAFEVTRADESQTPTGAVAAVGA